jgi:predicted permease
VFREILGHFVQAFGITAPILFVMALGVWLRQRKWIDANFVAVSNRLIFNMILPAMLFLATATSPLEESLNLSLVAFAALCIISVTVVVWSIAPALSVREKRGAFTQSVYRSNMGMIGLALCLSAYGDGALARAAIFLAPMTIVFNVIAVLILERAGGRHFRNILRNPLIIGIVAGIGWQLLNLPLPELALDSVGLFAQLAIPLALLCVGGSLQWKTLRPRHRDVLWACGLRMIVVPALLTVAAILWGFRGQELGIFFLMMAAPTATAAFVMAQEMTEFGPWTAETVALTTLVMPLTVTIGLTLLSAFQFI